MTRWGKIYAKHYKFIDKWFWLLPLRIKAFLFPHIYKPPHGWSWKMWKNYRKK